MQIMTDNYVRSIPQIDIPTIFSLDIHNGMIGYGKVLIFVFCNCYRLID